MYPVSAEFLQTLRVSHNVEIRVDAYKVNLSAMPVATDTPVLADVPISGGTVTIDPASQVRRTLDLTIADPSLAPGTDPNAPLSPFGAELHVQRGIRYPNGTIEWATLGWFRVESADVSPTNGLQITGADRSAFIQDNRFQGAVSSTPSNTIPFQIKLLIASVFPTLTCTDLTGSTARTSAVVWDQDHWQAILDCGTSIGADVFFTADGLPIIKPVPTISDPVRWLVDAGETGVLVDTDISATRDGAYSIVVASGEPSDGPPVIGYAYDTDPTSPTYSSGPFGAKPTFYSSPLLTTNAQASAAAQSILSKVRGLSRQLTLSVIPNPALDAGDVIQVRFPDGTVETHIVDAITIPLDAGTAMTIDTRTPSVDGTS